MVGHIDDNGVFFLKTLYHLSHDGVVVEGGIVVVGKQHAAPLTHIGPILLVVAFVEVLALWREAVVIVGVLSLEMEDGETGLVGICLAIFHHYLVVISQYSCVVFIQLGVANIKLGLAQDGIVEEESSTEVIHSFLGLGKKLVGDEGHTITCPSEQFGEERVVTPVALVAHGVQGEDILEYEAREIIWRYDVGKRYEIALPTQFHLPWCRFVGIAIELGVVLVVALTDYENDVLATEGTAIHLYILYACHEFVNLLGGQFIGIYTECKSIDGQIEVGTTFLC